MTPEPLNLSQKPQAGIFLIEASAGTGKTYSIANLYLHFILQGKKVSEILVVTFTEAATKELRERIRANLSSAFQVAAGTGNDQLIQSILDGYDVDENRTLLEKAILNFDQAAIFTIHGFCQRMLQENAFESMSLFDAELIENEADLQEEVIQDFIRSKSYSGQSAFSLKPKHLKELARNYSGQLVVDSVDQGKYEPLKNEFIKLYQESGQAQLEELKTTKQISHAQNFPYHPSKFQTYEEDLLSFISGKVSTTLRYALQALSQSEITKRTLKNKITPEHSLFEKAEELLPYFEGLTEKIEFLNYFEENFARRKSELNLLTFDDLINQLHKVLQKEGGDGPLHSRIRQQFKVALVDEFQDTDPVQYEIFSSAFGNKSLCPDHSFYMIGDPKQSIYAFRGADIFAYLKAKHKADRTFTLDTNYRSEPELVAAVNHLFLDKGKEEAFAFAPIDEEGIEFTSVNSPEDMPDKKRLVSDSAELSEAPLQLRWMTEPGESMSKTALEPTVPARVAADIVELLNLSSEGKAWFEKGREKHPVLPVDIAILTYTHPQASRLKEELNKNGIPCVIKKSGNVFSSPEAAALLRFLEAVHNPREKSILPLLLSSFFIYTAKELKALDSSVHFEYLKEFVEYRNNWDQYGFLQILQRFMNRHEIFNLALDHANGERVISNIYQLREILHDEEESKGIGLPGLIRFLSEKINSENRDDEEYLQRLETDSDAVQVLTIHKSKGLEFPIVFCPYVWSRDYARFNGDEILFHDEQGRACISLNKNAPQRDKYTRLATRENAGEQLRLLYVALTRAANRCYLYWGGLSKNDNVLNYLADQSFSSVQYLEGALPTQDIDLHKAYWQDRLASHPSIHFSQITSTQVPDLKDRESITQKLKEPQKLSLKFSNWMNGSYSALIKHHSKVYFSYEMEMARDDDDEIVFVEEDEEATGFFAFPKGANPGTAIHEMFEYIDFQDSSEWPKIVEEKLRKYRLHSDGINSDEEVLRKRIQICLEMIQNVVETQLNDGFTLSDISLSQRLDEMDFYFPVKDINLHRLSALFRKHYAGDEREDFADDLLTLKYRMDRGFLNGAIDLTFEKDGKFYIVDWKSNHLGNEYEDYNKQAVRDKVREKLYFLQYHIYTVALHLYLEKNLHGYSYKKHFGGIYYAFIRGMKPGTDFGIHHDHIPEGLVKDLTKMFLKGGRK